jgi:hypothetical protein
MLSAADLTEQTRPFVVGLVEREVRHTGSRMAAYDRVASMVGVSASWLRKLTGRRPVTIEAHEYINLARAYRALCERIEREAETERQRAITLREKINAALESDCGLVESAPRATPSRRL